MFKICVYVPENYVEKVKCALFDAGAGQMGNYDSCCWQTAGTGQFRPLDNSKPTIGSINQLERLTEIKLELMCADDRIRQAVDAMKHSHPYEEPAFDVWRVEDF